MQLPSGQVIKQDGVADDFAELDNFLDSYLVQLHTDNYAAQNPGASLPPGLNGAGGMQGHGIGPGALSAAGLMGAQNTFPSTLGQFGALSGLNSPQFAQNLNLNSFLQQQQQQQQQLQHPQQHLHMLQPGGGGGGGLQLGHQGPPPTQQPMYQPAAQAPAAAAQVKTVHARERRPTHRSSDQADDDDDQRAGSCGDSASSEEHKSRKKRGLAHEDNTSLAERRHLALQEKNRRAQRRFRERQKTKIQELHQQIEELTSKVGSLQTENAALHSRTSILEKVLDIRNEQIQVMQESKEVPQQLTDDPDTAALQLTAVSGQVLNLTADMVKELSPEQIYKIYQTYIKELSARLMEFNRTPSPPEELAAQVEKLTREVTFLLMRLSVVRPIETRQFIAVSRQYLNTEAEAIQMWKSVVKSMSLSEQQALEVVQWKALFLQKVEPIIEERKKLNVQIQAHLPQESFHTRNAITYIKTHEAVAKLRENLRAEHNVTIEFCAAVFKGVLSYVQMASLLVQAYPAVPDALAVASAIIADMQERGHQLPASFGNMPAVDASKGVGLLTPPLAGQPQGTQGPQRMPAALTAAVAAGAAPGSSVVEPAAAAVAAADAEGGRIGGLADSASALDGLAAVAAGSMGAI